MYLGCITLHYPKKGGEEQKEMKLQLHAVKQGYIFEIEVNFPYCTEQIPMQCKTLYHSEPIMKFSTEKTKENLNCGSCRLIFLITMVQPIWPEFTELGLS